MMLPRFLSFENYKVSDFKEFLSDNRIEVYLERDFEKESCCHRCGGALGSARGRHKMRLEA